MRLLREREKDSHTQGRKKSAAVSACFIAARIGLRITVRLSSAPDMTLILSSCRNVILPPRVHVTVTTSSTGGFTAKEMSVGRGSRGGGGPAGFHIGGRSYSIKISVPIGSPPWRPPTPQLFA